MSNDIGPQKKPHSVAQIRAQGKAVKRDLDDALQQLERVHREHHRNHYSRDYFEWEWRTVEHTGVWAYGGNCQKTEPELISVSLKVPDKEQLPGWYCYIGPTPSMQASS